MTYRAETGLDRTDVRSLLGPKTPQDIGFRVVLGLENVEPGGHELRAFVLGEDGTWYQAAHRPFWVYASAVVGLDPGRASSRVTVDAVRPDGGPVSRPAHEQNVPLGDVAVVTGWAATAMGAAPAGVCAVDESDRVWSAPCDVPRADVRAALGGSEERLGFELRIPTGELGRGHHCLTVWAYDRDGRRFGRAEEVTVDVAAAVRPFPAFARRTALPVHWATTIVVNDEDADDDGPIVLRPTRTIVCHRGGHLAIDGWAYVDEDGVPQPPAQVYLELCPEGAAIPPLRYHPLSGLRRKKQPRELAEPALEDAWFTYTLDTSNLEPQHYDLRVAVVALDRCAYASATLCKLDVRPSS
jgi:hypothetical protein